MARVYDELDERLSTFLRRQPVFFVATAPLAADGLLNLSPKGLDTFDILGPHRVAYLDLTGSGVETVAHLRENGRIADSCGYAVPLMSFEAERTRLDEWAESRGTDGLEVYRAEKNAESLDGLPGLP